MRRHSEVSAFILAGGASSRMGRDKALLQFGGEPLLVITARLLEPLVREVLVIGTPDRYAHLGLRALRDQAVGRNAKGELVQTPLVGIAAALLESGTTWNLILACDLPYLTAEWLDWLLDRAAASNAQIALPRTKRGIEPLAAAYRKECGIPILESLRRGILKVTDAISQFQIDYVEQAEWNPLDPHGNILENMNTLEDYHNATRFLADREHARRGNSR